MKPINYNKMKEYLNLYSKKFLLYAAILILILPACSEDVLEEKPLDFLAPENAYNTLPGSSRGYQVYTFRHGKDGLWYQSATITM